MEATAAVARHAGLLARARAARPRGRARARAWERGVGLAPSAARRRLLAASLGVGEPLPPAQSLGEEAVVLEVREYEYEANSIVSSGTLHTDPDADDIGTVPQAKTVRVKFVLKKQCAFGQQFLVVGDDPALGLWDPSKATALDWSEDHVWTAKTDLPANKLIEFKFLLREASGHVRWLHGANRTLETIETTNTLVVDEDWDDAEKQIVSEEEELSIGAEDVVSPEDLALSNGTMLAGNIITDETDETGVADAPPQGEMIVANETDQTQLMLHKDETANETDQPQVNTDSDEKCQPQLMPHKDETVLEELLEEVKSVAQNGSNDVNDTTFSQEGALLANRPTSILENDLAWAGKAMQQVLRILGFQIGTTKT